MNNYCEEHAHLKELAENAAQAWQLQISSHLGCSIRVLVTGSLQTGLYHGPKPAHHSLNPEHPKNCQLMNELDIRIVVPTALSPHDPTILNVIQSVCGAPFSNCTFVTRWHRRIPISFAYKYSNLHSEVALEWEITVNQEPYLETSLFWRSVFTEEEIHFQNRLRKAYRDSGISSAEFHKLKETQAAIARWRIVAAYVLEIHFTNQTSPPISFPYLGEPHEIAKPLVDMWLMGQQGICPPDQVSIVEINSIQNDLKRFGLCDPPKQPEWVTHAEELQREVQIGLGLI